MPFRLVIIVNLVHPKSNQEHNLCFMLYALCFMLLHPCSDDVQVHDPKPLVKRLEDI
jgi:hypothetical protein